MKNSTISKQRSYLTDLFSTNAYKSRKLSMLWLMLLMLLLLPTRMVAQTTTEDPRCALFKGLEGISDVTFTDNGEYPWQMLDLKAEGMTAVSSYFTAESKGLMSSYNVDESTSVTEIRFKVSKPILLTSQVLVSSEEEGLLFINVDNKLNLSISGEKQTEYKVLLSAGEHSLELNYYHNGYSGSEYANRAFLYNLKTSTTIDDNVADYESSNNTLTFKKIKSDNLEDLDLSRIAMVNNEQTVSDMCTLLGIDNSAIKSVVFDKSFKTYAPTSLISFFADLNSLQTITDLEYLNTANVTEMSYMFYGCKNLSSLDVTKFNTANVTKMLSMFESCSGLTSLDLTNFNTANVTDMDRMFFNCSTLTTIYASNNFVTTKVEHGLDMFYDCSKLKGYSDSKTDHTYANCGTDGYFTPVFDYAEFDNATGTLTFRRSLSKPAGAYDLNEGNNEPGWLTQKENIYKVVFDASFANARPTSCYYWFCGCSKLTDIEGIENLNTENVTNMNSMFDRCSALTSLDLTNFNTAKVSDMSYMFMGCSALTTIFVSDKFVTDQVTDGREMFHMCINLIGAIEYDGSKSDHTYANYETGYFSPEGGFPGYAVFDEGTGTLTFKWSNSTSIPTGAYDLNEGDNKPGWYDKREKIKTVVFDASFACARPTSCFYWFYGCKNLVNIKGIENLNTEKVTMMYSMFEKCSALTSLDLTNFNTANVTDMSNMFYDCSTLTTIYASDKFVTIQVTYDWGMFYSCNKLIGAIKYDGNNNKDYANYETGYFTPKGGFPGYAKFDEGTGTLTFTSGPSKPEGAYDLYAGIYYPGWWYGQRGKIKTVVFDASFANARPKSCYGWFSGCSNLTEIKGIEYLNTEKVTNMQEMFNACSKLTSLNLSNFNTAEVTNMSYMFKSCKALTSLNLSNFNTEKVTDMQGMFWECSDLTSLNLTSLNTENVTDMTGMFKDCTNLTSLDLSNFNTAKVTKMNQMFFQCYALTSLDLSSFNTAEVTKMDNMFKSCNDLTSLDLSNFNTAKVTNMTNMFYGCNALTSLDLSSFNTAEVTDMSNMFRLCYALTSLDLSNFNTAKVTDMSYMFKSCKALTSLDLTSFNTAKVENMTEMFNNCPALTTIYASDKFVTTKVSNGGNMFKDCKNLKGFIDYINNTDKTDHTYANYVDGYFTKLVVRNGDERYGITGETTQLTVDNLALNDNKDFVAYEPFTATAASYSRTINTTWATLCLPFDVSLDDQNFRAFELGSVNNDEVVLKELNTIIPAGTPVIIKMTNGATELSFNVANKEIAKDVKTPESADGDYQLQGLYTQKVFSKDADNNCYIVKGNKLMNPAKLLENTKVTKVVSKPFRAYMVDKSSAPAAGAKMFSIGFDDSITTIDTINTIANDKAEYYDLQGKRLNEPQKGINIVKRGGKTMKVIIK